MADDDGSKNCDDKTGEQIKELQQTVKGLAILVQQGQTVQAKNQQNFDALIGKLDKMAEPPVKKVDPDAINELDNSEFLNVVIKEMGKLVDEKVGAVTSRIELTDNRLNQSDAAMAIKNLGKPDFFEWGKEMKELLEKNPALSPKQLYSLARGSNETKSAEMDAKYAEDDDKKVSPGFLGLTPTSGVTTDSDEKLTDDEAREKAWDETVEQFPGLSQMEG